MVYLLIEKMELHIMTKKTFTYKDSGVDIKAGEELVHSIKDIVGRVDMLIKKLYNIIE